MQPMTMSTCARARAGGGETLEGENVCAPSPTCNDRRTPLCAPCHTPATGRCSLCTPLSPQCPKNVRSCSAVQRWRPRATSPPCSPCPNHEASRRARPRRPARVRPPYAPARRLNQTNRRTAMNKSRTSTTTSQPFGLPRAAESDCCARCSLSCPFHTLTSLSASCATGADACRRSLPTTTPMSVFSRSGRVHGIAASLCSSARIAPSSPPSVAALSRSLIRSTSASPR
mmetsp:Transcript_6267/g.21030  ORF Transcript_6267/g.21030 Transcript_6267/m.21030 type:complete len:229 (-) Transcript_6267:277-963(-)